MFTPILAHAGLNNWTDWDTLGLLLSLILYPFFKVLIPQSLMLGSSCSIMTRLSQPIAVLLPTVLLYVLLRRRSIRRRNCILSAVVLYSSLTLTTNLIGDRGYYQWAWDRDVRSGSIALLEQGDTAKAFSKRLAAGVPGSTTGAWRIDNVSGHQTSGIVFIYPDGSWVALLMNNSFIKKLGERLPFYSCYNVARDSGGEWMESYTHFSDGGHMRPLSALSSSVAAREYLTKYDFKPIKQGISPTRKSTVRLRLP